MPTLQPGSTSQAFDVDIGQTVSVTPGSGGTMLVEYTTNSETDIRNGSATWQAWTAGTVSAATSDVAMFPMFARVTAYTAAGSYELSGSGLSAVPNQYLAWKSDVVSARDPVSAAAVVRAAIGENASISFVDSARTSFPDEVVRLSASGCACASPCYISRIRCITGTSVALTVYDNPAASSGTTLYSGTLSAGQEAAISTSIRAINGVRAVFASGSFDFYIGQEGA